MFNNILTCYHTHGRFQEQMALKNISDLTTEVYSSILSINQEFRTMTFEFDKRFSNLIKEYDSLYNEVLDCTGKRLSSHFSIRCVFKKYVLYNVLPDLFFKYLISFYDEFSSKINYKIEKSKILRECKSNRLEYQTYSCRKGFHNEEILDLQKIKKTEYLDLLYFVHRLERMCINILGLDIQHIRITLYGEIEMCEFYNTMLNWRVFNINTGLFSSNYELFFDENENPSFYRLRTTKNLFFYKNMFLLNIMKEYADASEPENDPRFLMLKEMIKKYVYFYRIPDVYKTPRSCCSFAKEPKIYEKSKIYVQYFSYILYPENSFHFKKHYMSIIEQYIRVFQTRNRLIYRDIARNRKINKK
ncbi:hypothetical protein CDIK_1811 [Cucumispora dikerogammari]|nr:hypothetical protein CDIK_1811 [Cucumispora dikerogammari]